MSDVTHILSRIESGDPHAAEQLLPLVYAELRKLAAAKLAQEKPGQTLQATALVHEAYLRLVPNSVANPADKASPGRKTGEPEPHWNGRAHFFGAAAEAMRRILVDRARQKRGPKRGGNRERVDLEYAHNVADCRADEILAVNEALEGLARDSPRKAALVKLRYFAGLTLDEAAVTLGISSATADRDWAYAKAFLFAAFQDAESG